MKPVIVINRLVIQPGKMDEFIELQRTFADGLPTSGLIGGRMYRGVDDRSAVLVSMFESKSALDAIRHTTDFKAHLAQLEPLIESSAPTVYEEAYTTGGFR